MIVHEEEDWRFQRWLHVFEEFLQISQQLHIRRQSVPLRILPLLLFSKFGMAETLFCITSFHIHDGKSATNTRVQRGFKTSPQSQFWDVMRCGGTTATCFIIL
jgi:hypothetical protein